MDRELIEMTGLEVLIQALRNQEQYDEDGVYCIVSRQAVDEAIALLSASPGESDGLRWRKVRGMSLQDVQRVFHPVWDNENGGFDAEKTMLNRDKLIDQAIAGESK